jgi:exodeoxyribonuclease VII large subunit
VIAGIEQRINQRVGEVKANFEQVYALTARASQSAKDQAGKFEMTVRSEALWHLAQGKQGASEHLAAIRMDAMQGVRKAAEQSRDAFQTVKTQVAAQLADARGDVPALWSQVALGSAHALRTAAAENAALKDGILERARQEATRARQSSRDALDAVSDSARRLVRSAAADSQALLREITGQGPEKTLQRGFAIVRSQSGKPLTRVSQAIDGAAIEIEFQDGRVAATTQKYL